MCVCGSICLPSQVLSEAALEQRLRRKCTDGNKRKAAGGADAVRLYQNTENRGVLMDLLIKNNFQRPLMLLLFLVNVHVMHSFQGSVPESSHTLDHRRENKAHGAEGGLVHGDGNGNAAEHERVLVSVCFEPHSVLNVEMHTVVVSLCNM